jgi:hypothetical protein
MWDTGPDPKHCQFFNIGNASLFRLNSSQPMLGTFDPAVGFRLLYLGKTHGEASKSAAVFKEVPIHDLKAQDVLLSKDGKTLYVAPKLYDESKYLIALDMPLGLGGGGGSPAIQH